VGGGRHPGLQQLQRRRRALTGVNDADYQPPFRFTGTLNKLTIKIDRPQLSAEDTKSLQAAMRTKAVSE
jgi:arylsulfatase